jgi:hypothetical protein
VNDTTDLSSGNKFRKSIGVIPAIQEKFMKKIQLILISMLIPLTALSGDPVVIPFPLEASSLEAHHILVNQDAFLRVEYRVKPGGPVIFDEEAEKLWWLGTRPVLMLGASGIPIPQSLSSRVSFYLTVYSDDDLILINNALIHPLSQAVSIQSSPETIARSLSSAVTLDVTYLAEVANYLAGNLSSVSITASSYSIDGVGEVIDSSGQWKGYGSWQENTNELRTPKTYTGIGVDPGWSLDYKGLTIADEVMPGILFCPPDGNGYFGMIYSQSDGMSISIPNSGVWGGESINFKMGGAPKMTLFEYGLVLGGESPLERNLLVLNYLDDAEMEVQSTYGKATLFIDGTTGNNEVQFQVNGTYKGALGYNSSSNYLYLYQGGNVVLKNGNLGVGTLTPNGRLDVNGAIYQRGGLIHADYVFEDDYELESIDEHASFMWREKHLPAITRATRDEEGREVVEVGAHRRGIVEELEKAHIYIEELQNRLNALERTMNQILLSKSGSK